MHSHTTNRQNVLAGSFNSHKLISEYLYEILLRVQPNHFSSITMSMEYLFCHHSFFFQFVFFSSNKTIALFSSIHKRIIAQNTGLHLLCRIIA